VNHVVFADANNVAAKQLLADTYEQLGYQSESARILSSNGVQEYGVIDLAVS
jgi:alkyl sulfatase BDS1-like metallo-beta-lactamase superfamily hydrolase